MPKVFHLTLILEIGDDTPHPDEWNWPGHLLGNVPGLRGLGIIESKERPFSSMEDDPLMHTHH